MRTLWPERGAALARDRRRRREKKSGVCSALVRPVNEISRNFHSIRALLEIYHPCLKHQLAHLGSKSLGGFNKSDKVFSLCRIVS